MKPAFLAFGHFGRGGAGVAFLVVAALLLVWIACRPWNGQPPRT